MIFYMVMEDYANYHRSLFLDVIHIPYNDHRNKKKFKKKIFYTFLTVDSIRLLPKANNKIPATISSIPIRIDIAPTQTLLLTMISKNLEL